MAFQPLKPFEKQVLEKLLLIEDPRSSRLAPQIDSLFSEMDDDGKILYLTSPDHEGQLRRREMARDVEAMGYYRDCVGRIADLIVFIDESGQLSALEFVNYDGIPFDQENIDVQLIEVRSRSM